MGTEARNVECFSAQSGLGGIIYATDSEPAVGAFQLRARVGLVSVGETIEVEYLRNGNRVKVNARIAAAPL